LDPPVEFLEGGVQLLGGLVKDLEAKALVLRAKEKVGVFVDGFCFGEGVEEPVVYGFGGRC